MNEIEPMSIVGKPAKKMQIRVSLVAIVALCLSACSAHGSEPSNSLSSDPAPERIADNITVLFQQTLDEANLNEYGKEIFERAVQTGQISEDDYEDAHATLVSCLDSKGIDITYSKTTTGVYYMNAWVMPDNLTDDYVNREMSACEDEVDWPAIESMYSMQQNDPELYADPDEVIVRCLWDDDIVPTTYTAKDFSRDFPNQTPFDKTDPQVLDCLQRGGINYQVTG